MWGQALGANITVIPWGETYLALKQGMVEAVTSPLDSLYDIKFTEVCKYVTEIREFYQNQTITINTKKWQSFSPAIQKAFNDAAYGDGPDNEYETLCSGGEGHAEDDG